MLCGVVFEWRTEIICSYFLFFFSLSSFLFFLVLCGVVFEWWSEIICSSVPSKQLELTVGKKLMTSRLASPGNGLKSRGWLLAFTSCSVLFFFVFVCVCVCVCVCVFVCLCVALVKCKGLECVYLFFFFFSVLC